MSESETPHIVPGEFHYHPVRRKRGSKLPKQIFAIGKGDYLLGYCFLHGCGEWTFSQGERSPALTMNALCFITRAMAQPEKVYDNLTNVVKEHKAEQVRLRAIRRRAKSMKAKGAK